MANISTNTAKDVLDKRDEKSKSHLEQYAPVWIIDEIECLSRSIEFHPTNDSNYIFQ